MDRFYEVIGEGEDVLTPLQMSIRAAIVFIIALIFIRITGRRAFGQRSAFDMVMGILLGAILSRSVIKSDIPFFGPIAAAGVICFLHFALALITTYSGTFGEIVKGRAKVLYKDGQKNRKHMHGSFITDRDLKEGMRKTANVDDESKIEEAWLERDGSISVIKKE